MVPTVSQVGRDHSPATAGSAAERAAARERAYRMMREVQDSEGDLVLSAEDVERFVDEAHARGWPDVVCANLYLDVLRVLPEGWEQALAATSRLLECAEALGDPAMTATGLASRSRLVLSSGESAASLGADQDLARATVLLEGASGGALELASAHIECAIAYALRSLRELELDHYKRAEALARHEPEASVLLPAILYNQAEAHLNTAAALRELGDPEPVESQARRAAEALAAAEIPDMPEGWRDELQAYATLLAAIAPSAGVAVPAARRPARKEFAGHVRLAGALQTEDRAAALAQARAAVSAIDRVPNPEIHDLARCVAAELEAAIIGHETEGLAYARHLARLRWETRLSTLAAMQSLLHAERLRSEYALLSQHAFLDELTGLGNRRALSRYLDAIAAEGVTSIAVVLLDIDRFKMINDTHGHVVGDNVLIRVAGLLHASVRPGDLAVRLGGDEFLLVLSGVPASAARGRAETIHVAIGAETWQYVSEGLHVTVSLGVSSGAPERHGEALAAADAALYRSKASGGDCVSEG